MRGSDNTRDAGIRAWVEVLNPDLLAQFHGVGESQGSDKSDDRSEDISIIERIVEKRTVNWLNKQATLSLGESRISSPRFDKLLVASLRIPVFISFLPMLKEAAIIRTTNSWHTHVKVKSDKMCLHYTRGPSEQRRVTHPRGRNLTMRWRIVICFGEADFSVPMEDVRLGVDHGNLWRWTERVRAW